MWKAILIVLGVVLVGAAGLFATLPGVLTRPTICDGEVPVWFSGSCSEPALVEYLWPPERWGAPTYCNGLCTDPYSDRIREEWIRTHGTDSLAE